MWRQSTTYLWPFWSSFLFLVTYLRSTMWRQSTTCLWPFWSSFLFSVTYLRSTMWRQSTTCLWQFWSSFLFSVTYLRSTMWRQSTTCLWPFWSSLFSVFSDLFEINHVKTIYHMFVAILIVFVFCFQWPIWDQPREDNLPHVCGHFDRLCFLFSVTYLRSTMWRQSTTCLWPFWSSLFSVFSDLFEINHMKTIYHMFVAILIVFVFCFQWPIWDQPCEDNLPHVCGHSDRLFCFQWPIWDQPCEDNLPHVCGHFDCLCFLFSVTYLRSTMWRQSTTCLWPFWSSLFSVFSDLFEINHMKTIYHMFVAILIVFVFCFQWPIWDQPCEDNLPHVCGHSDRLFCFQWPIWDQPCEDNLPHVCGHFDCLCFLFSVTYLRSTMWSQSTTCLWPFWSSLFSVFSDLFEINQVKTIYHMFVAILIVFVFCFQWPIWDQPCEDNLPHVCGHSDRLFCFQWPIWDQPREDNLPHVCGHSDRLFCFQWPIWDQPCEDNLPHVCGHSDRLFCFQWPIWDQPREDNLPHVCGHFDRLFWFQWPIWDQPCEDNLPHVCGHSDRLFCFQWPIWDQPCEDNLPHVCGHSDHLFCFQWPIWDPSCEDNLPHVCGHSDRLCFCFQWPIWDQPCEDNLPHVCGHSDRLFCFQWPIWDQPCEDNLPHVCGHSDRLCFLFSVTYLRSTMWRQSTTCLWSFWSSFLFSVTYLRSTTWRQSTTCLWSFWSSLFSVYSDLFEINHVKTIYHMFVAILMVFVFCFQWPIWDQPCEDNLPHVCGHSDRLCFLFSVIYLRSTMWRQSTTCLWPFWSSLFSVSIDLFEINHVKTIYHMFVAILIVFIFWFQWPIWDQPCEDNLPHVCGHSDRLYFLVSVTYLRSTMWRQSTTCLWPFWSSLFSVFSDLFEINHVKTIYHMFVAILIVFVFCFQWPIWDQPCEDNLPHVCGHSNRLCFLFSVTYLRSIMWRQSTTCLWPFWSSFLFSVTRVPTVLEKSLNFGFSLKSPWKWICPWKVLEFRGPSLKFQLVVLDFLFCVFWTESLNAYSKLRGTRANFPPKKFGSLRSQQFTS